MNIPQLRFPEYEEKWNSRKLEKYILDHKGGAPLKPSDFVRFSKFEVIPKKAITGGGKLLLDLEQATYCSEEFFRNYKNSIVDNSFLITTLRDLVPSGPNIGFIVKNESKSKYMLAQGVYGIKINTEELIEDFLIQLSNTSKYRKLMQTLKVGSTQVHIRNSIFFGIDVVSPSLPEQQKIAGFLTAVDDKLQALKKKKELLEQYKKGVMQKIFSQEIRFRDENREDFPDWEEKKLGEVAKYYDGTHQTPNYTETGIPFYSVEHVTANNFSSTKFISNEVFEKENIRVCLEKGDILMTRIGDIGTPKYIDWDVKASFYVSLALIKQSDRINSNYLYHFITSSDFQKELYKRTIHVAFPKKINLGEIGNCLVDCPSLSEQNCIANFLSVLDDKITYCQMQIEQTGQWKRGLLQKMFV